MVRLMNYNEKYSAEQENPMAIQCTEHKQSNIIPYFWYFEYTSEPSS